MSAEATAAPGPEACAPAPPAQPPAPAAPPAGATFDLKPLNPSSKYVKLNVGGSLHYTTLQTLGKQDTMLKAMFSGRMEVLTDSEGRARAAPLPHSLPPTAPPPVLLSRSLPPAPPPLPRHLLTAPVLLPPPSCPATC